ncbi:MAG: hypothetical protein AB7O59_13345 [Pirellulales bacterium]
MQFVEMTGATLFRLADEDQVPQLRAAGVDDQTKIRINRQGDVEMLTRGSWSVIGGLLGDFEVRIRRLTGQGWQ